MRQAGKTWYEKMTAPDGAAAFGEGTTCSGPTLADLAAVTELSFK
jgi:hypothetical protein